MGWWTHKDERRSDATQIGCQAKGGPIGTPPSIEPMEALFEPAAEGTRGVDQRIVLRGIPWEVYQRLADARGESSVPRLAFLEGALEIMSPSDQHEWIKTMFDRLLQAYAEEMGIELGPLGSTTLRSERTQRAAEPDQSYVLGPRPVRARAPDLVIEVVLTSGGVDKLSVYRHVGVKEAWFRRNGRIDVFVLGKDGRAVRKRSQLLPDVDLELLARLVVAGRAVRKRSQLLPDVDLELLARLVVAGRPTAALKAFRAALRKRRPR